MERGASSDALSMARTNEQTDDIPAEHQNASPLLRLPAELRNKIYEYVLDVDYITVVYSCGYSEQGEYKQSIKPHVYVSDSRGQSSGSLQDLSQFNTLAVTCGQLRAETKLLPYTLNDFQWFQTPHGYLMAFIIRLPDHIKEIVKVLRMPVTSRDEVLMLQSRSSSSKVFFRPLGKLSSLEKIIVWMDVGPRLTERAKLSIKNMLE